MSDRDTERRLSRLKNTAGLLDSRFRIPATNFRFGLDSIIGLIPGIGDVVGTVVSAWIVVEARRLGAPRRLILRMAWNVLVDSVLGAVPLVGDLFDAAWKSNNRNVALLERYLEERD